MTCLADESQCLASNSRRSYSVCFLYCSLAFLCGTGWCPGSGISCRCGPSSKEKQQQLYRALLSFPGPQAKSLTCFCSVPLSVGMLMPMAKPSNLPQKWDI